MTIVVALLAGVAAASATRFAIRRLIATTALRRSNYRGIPVATGLGIAPLAGLMAGIALLAFAAELSPGAVVAGAWFMPLAAAGCFAALGLFDDIASAASAGGERGFAGHGRALVKGKLSTGGLKLAGGTLLSFSLAAPATDGFAFALAGGAVIALSANLLNAFDLRPGRAGKMFLLGAVPLAVVAGPLRGVVVSAAAAIVAFLPFDLRERAMLGDAGSNAFGALLGACAVLLASPTTLLIVLGVLVVLQVLAETVTFSRIFDAVAPLRALDRVGRVE